MAKNAVAVKAQDGEVIQPWTKDAKADSVDVESLVAKVNKLADGAAIEKLGYKVMTESPQAFATVRNVRALLQALSIKHVALTGKVDFITDVAQFFANHDNSGNRFRQFMLNKGPVDWDREAKAFTIDRTKRAAMQKAIQKDGDAFVKNLVDGENRGEGEFEPYNYKEAFARFWKQAISKRNNAPARLNKATEAGAKVMDDFSFMDETAPIAAKMGLPVPA
jgi:hypothetical protein